MASQKFYRIMAKDRSVFDDANDRGAFHISPFTKKELEEMQEMGITPPIDPEDLKFDERFGWIEVLAEGAICCCDSPEMLIHYINDALAGGVTEGDNLKIVEFEGEYIDTLPDGDIARPIRLLREFSVKEFLEEYK